MTVLPLKRKNQAYREVQDDEGNVWYVNRHGAAFRHEPDPHFPGMEITIFPENWGEVVDAARASGLKRCMCC